MSRMVTVKTGPHSYAQGEPINIDRLQVAAFGEMQERIKRMEHALNVIAEWGETADDAEAIAGRKHTARLARRATQPAVVDPVEKVAREMALAMFGDESRWPGQYVAAEAAIVVFSKEGAA